jgi:WD40 repeat protein
MFTENIVWMMPEGRRAFQLEEEAIMAVSPDGTYIYTFDNVTDIVRTRRVGDFKILNEVELLIPIWEDSKIYSLYLENPIISPSGKHFAGYIYDLGIFTWDLETGLEVEELFDSGYWGYYDPMGRYYILLKYEKVLIYNLVSYDLDSQLELDYQCWSTIKSLFFSPDGTYILLACNGLKKYRVHDDYSMEFVENIPFEYNSSYYGGLAVSPDNELIAVDDESQIVILDFESGNVLAQLPAHLDEIVSIAFSLDGHYLATSSFDGTVKLWGISPGE